MLHPIYRSVLRTAAEEAQKRAAAEAHAHAAVPVGLGQNRIPGALGFCSDPALRVLQLLLELKLI
mgnify:CR=1